MLKKDSLQCPEGLLIAVGPTGDWIKGNSYKDSERKEESQRESLRILTEYIYHHQQNVHGHDGL